MVGPKSSALAVVDNDKCIACFRCVDVCDDDAMLAPRRDTPKIFATDPKTADITTINNLLRRTEIDPVRPICPCSSTSAQEVAAAILNGAHDMREIALQTGVQSGCLMYCFAPVHRMLTPYLGHAIESPHKNQWYGSSTGISEVSDETAAKYPMFYIAEDKRRLAQEREDALAAALKPA
jgi:bacterioferritin-associated ferredoxin